LRSPERTLAFLPARYKVGKPLDRHNLLLRRLKKVAKKLGVPEEIDFRSFRTMHASMMRRLGGRLEVAQRFGPRITMLYVSAHYRRLKRALR
jgi:hypothetical protein